MRIQLLSDLHIEFQSYTVAKTSADVIVLAGDIGVGHEGLEWAAAEGRQLGKEVIYVPGNHEYYHHDLYELDERLRAKAALLGVHFLQNDSVTLSGVRFLGTTFWTDYEVPKEEPLNRKFWVIRRGLADHSVIRFGDRKFKPEDALELHTKAVNWLRGELANSPRQLPTVVVTHHAPSLACQHPEIGINSMAGAFLSDLDELVSQAALWCFGHTHACLDTVIGGTRLISNQRGYPYERTYGFDGRKVIQVPGTGLTNHQD